MPARSDLTGMRFGKLLVLSECERKGRDRMWRVGCECGKEEIFPHRRLTEVSGRIDCCSKCRTVPCKICGQPATVVKGLTRYCSDACRASARIKQWREAAVRISQDPQKKQALRVRKTVRRADPVKGDQMRVVELAWRAKRKLDPALVEKDREEKRRIYLKARERIVEARRVAKQTMSPEDRERTEARQRAYDVKRLALRKVLDAVNPERLAARNEKAASRRRERALAELIKEARAIFEKK